VDLSGTLGSARDIAGRDIAHGDIVYGDKGIDAESLVASMRREMVEAAEAAGLQRGMIIMLARRLKPDALSFDQAVVELDRAVKVSLDVIARVRGVPMTTTLSAGYWPGLRSGSGPTILTVGYAPSMRRLKKRRHAARDH